MVLKLSSNVSDVFAKVLKLSPEVNECLPLAQGLHLSAAGEVLLCRAQEPQAAGRGLY
jgi:hypothetical protein